MKKFTLKVNLSILCLFITIGAFAQTVYQTVGIIGTATANDWNASTPMVVSPGDPHQWTLGLQLEQGEVKFRANDSWTVNWGNTNFPSGNAYQDGPNIPIPTAGYYAISFNDVTGAYNFVASTQEAYASVGIIGSSTPGGWDNSTPMTQDANDPHAWSISITLTSGEVKFRANNAWDVNWGNSSFPGGTAVRDGQNIPVVIGGQYTVTFNDVTGVYYFDNPSQPDYETVGIIGTATVNGWDSSTPMTLGSDGHIWTLTNFTLFTGEAKFRANNSWDINWGGNTFPNGTGVPNGPNIIIPAGVYNITFNDATLQYTFESINIPVGPIVTLSPNLPTIDDEVTITYDANQGVSGLRNADKVYLHSGVIFSGYDGTSWSNVVGNWGQDDGVGEMTRVPGSTNLWQITIPSIREYYHLGSAGPVFRLGMVFRNADGSQTGKSNTDGDIFVRINPGDYVRFLEPVENQIFGQAGQQILIRGEASDLTNPFTIEINEGAGYQEVARVFDDQIISYNYTIGTATTVRVRLKAVLENATITKEKILSITIRQPNPVVALPEGVKNGINYDPNDPTKATLVLLAPGKQFAYAVGDFNNWETSDAYQMNVTPDGEYFWIELNGLEPQREYAFQYWVDGTIKIGDPYADKVADPFNDSSIPSDVYPNPLGYSRTQDGIATVLQTGQTPYVWNSTGVSGGRPAKENLVVYELLVRDFLGSHSYRDLTDTLSYLKRLGVNAIELLPIMEFEGNESWGYNPSYLFAPDKYYGTKNDLKAFIDKAHQEGFVVLLDMVLNHQFGQSPMVRLYWDAALAKPSPSSPWFNPDATHPFNVGYDFNHESAYTKRYVDDVNRYWLQEYRFDGFRFDLSKGFTQTNNPNDVGAWSAYDQSRVDILKRMTDQIRSVDPGAYVIMEHLAVNEEEKVLADYGIMLWGNMNHSYNDVINGDISEDLNWTLSSTRGWNQKNLVPYMESHDEERLMVRALNSGGSSGDYDIRQLDVALERIKLASAFFYTLPGAKMMWQFGELGYDVPIDFNGRTGNKPIPWGDQDGMNYYDDPARMKLYKATAAIINLVDDHNIVFEQGNFSWTPSGQLRRINIDHANMNVTIIGNFGVTAGAIAPQFQHTGTWYDFFAGKAVSITSTTQSITLEPGEFHIYLDQPVQFPERGLVKTRVEIFAPENLQASYSNGNISLSWDDTSEGETGFVVERRQDSETFSTLVTLGEDVITYSDNSITDGVTYEYRVKTTSDVRPHSDWSNSAVVDLEIAAPTGLIAETQNKSSVLLTWSDNSSHETSYVIERAETKGNKTTPFTIFATVGADESSYIDIDIQNGRRYLYRVYAIDDDEQSAYSNEASGRKKGGKRNNLELYPNPVSTELVVSQDTDEKGHYKILNLQGRVVSQFELGTHKSEVSIDVTGWKEGIYVLIGTYVDGTVVRENIMVRR